MNIDVRTLLIAGRLTRRAVLKHGLVGVGGLMLSELGRVRVGGGPAGEPTSAPARAKSVIQIWLWGGASHLDTFDPKPGAGYDYCGPLNKPVETNVDGIRIGELLPLLAQQADKYALIRGMTHGNNAHETAAYWCRLAQAGRAAGLSLRWGSRVTDERVRPGVRGARAAVHRVDFAAGAVFRGGIHGVAVQAVRDRWRSEREAFRRGRDCRGGCQRRAAAAGGSCCTSWIRWRGRCRRMSSSSGSMSAKRGRTT